MRTLFIIVKITYHIKWRMTFFTKDRMDTGLLTIPKGRKSNVEHIWYSRTGIPTGGIFGSQFSIKRHFKKISARNESGSGW